MDLQPAKQRMEKNLLKFLYPPKEMHSAHLGFPQRLLWFSSFTMPRREGTFVNSTEMQRVKNAALCPQMNHENGEKRKEIGTRERKFLCFLLGKAAYSLIPGLSREKRRQVTQKCPWNGRRRALKSWHFIFGVFFLFFIHCLLREREEKLWPSWFLPQLLDMKIILFFPF